MRRRQDLGDLGVPGDDPLGRRDLPANVASLAEADHGIHPWDAHQRGGLGPPVRGRIADQHGGLDAKGLALTGRLEHIRVGSAAGVFGQDHAIGFQLPLGELGRHHAVPAQLSFRV